MHPGKLIRLRQFLDPSGRTFIVAIDQTIPQGLQSALTDPVSVIEQLMSCQVDALLLHSGLIKVAASVLAGHKPFLVKLTTATIASKDKTNRFLVDSVEHALSLGASGVALNLFVGSEYEREMFAQFACSVETCDQLGLPVLAMIHPMPQDQFNPAKLAYACRVGAELGADLVKTDFPGSVKDFREVINSCPVPVLVEESPLSEDEAGTIKTVRRALKAGGSGFMFGHRVWGHQDIHAICARLNHLTHA